jgi:hypothetical protein
LFFQTKNEVKTSWEGGEPVSSTSVAKPHLPNQFLGILDHKVHTVHNQVGSGGTIFLNISLIIENFEYRCRKGSCSENKPFAIIFFL